MVRGTTIRKMCFFKNLDASITVAITLIVKITGQSAGLLELVSTKLVGRIGRGPRKDPVVFLSNLSDLMGLSRGSMTFPSTLFMM